MEGFIPGYISVYGGDLFDSRMRGMMNMPQDSVSAWKAADSRLAFEIFKN